VVVPRDQYGCFFDGDSYLILAVSYHHCLQVFVETALFSRLVLSGLPTENNLLVGCPSFALHVIALISAGNISPFP